MEPHILFKLRFKDKGFLFVLVLLQLYLTGKVSANDNINSLFLANSLSNMCKKYMHAYLHCCDSKLESQAVRTTISHKFSPRISLEVTTVELAFKAESSSGHFNGQTPSAHTFPV